ncbi:Acetyltransferase involved in cellulose biosynthesis, CelD/BcsL family [Neorhodopirellula lusitana]|uniref:Acetyltransferase involved in cellulose biosynthesis, CelD/BcsL family n=1 Tax=Neorhodopirellula lusitana TaxID=445327 RepID=A0ABY1QCY8_9BACT|nr:GNAT family N-acetyltransferase [Neorhodopirellula lusitana]SMP65737.1 Acetyltransferase involved in cellulose biosynthesis, CelD/BcsL family [Neorhodopirellula lusitana]
MLPDVTPLPSPSHSDQARSRVGAPLNKSVDRENWEDVAPSFAKSSDRSVVQTSQIQVVPFDDLSIDLLQKWDELRWSAENAKLFDQPFFSPRFAEAVNRARGDVFVAVAMAPGQDAHSPNLTPEHAIGFLPFHRVGRLGVPVGRFLNDAQNVIGLAAERVDWSAWLQACNVIAFDMHSIVQGDPAWNDDYQLDTVRAFRADFEGNSEQFLRRLERQHRTIGKQGQKTRKLNREVGDVRLEVDCRCPKVLKQAIQWKRAQYQRTHILDLFLPDWTRKLVDELHNWDDHDLRGGAAESEYAPDQAAMTPPAPGDAECSRLDMQPLKGILSVLWAGDQVVAAHYGMVERGRLHYWFPTYDPKYARYSPGTALFTELVRAASSHGIDCIDMGYGEQPYKQKQTATTSEVAYGTITDSKWHRFSFSLENRVVACLKQIPMKELIKKGWRTVNPTAGIKKLS